MMASYNNQKVLKPLWFAGLLTGFIGVLGIFEDQFKPAKTVFFLSCKMASLPDSPNSG